MKLSTEQIEQLFNFTKKHYVEHYDVQVELVDHLANAIEDQWKENPNILFEDALQTEFNKFGIFGFIIKYCNYFRHLKMIKKIKKWKSA